VLYRNQPGERHDAFAREKTLIKLAKKVEGLDSPRFRKCVTGGEHNGWVKKTGAAFKKSGYQATPTVLLDGKDVYGNRSQPLTTDELKQRVEQST
jgi:predicted DsbA family dithiol-disulfide isomerase